MIFKNGLYKLNFFIQRILFRNNAEAAGPGFYEATKGYGPILARSRLEVVPKGAVNPVAEKGDKPDKADVTHIDIGVDLKLRVNGRKSILLERGISRSTISKDRADLYVSFKGEKVIFSLVQARSGSRITQKHKRSPRNIHLVVTPGGNPKIHVDEFAVVNGLEEGYAYARRKSVPQVDSEKVLLDFKALLTDVFTVRTLTTRRQLQSNDRVGIHKALARLEISAPGIMPYGRHVKGALLRNSR